MRAPGGGSRARGIGEGGGGLHSSNRSSILQKEEAIGKADMLINSGWETTPWEQHVRHWGWGWGRKGFKRIHHFSKSGLRPLGPPQGEGTLLHCYGVDWDGHISMSLHRNTVLNVIYADLAFQLSEKENRALRNVYNLCVSWSKHQRCRGIKIIK